jgi:gamma-glutamyltranspeptidase/glutathione hydrolase
LVLGLWICCALLPAALAQTLLQPTRYDLSSEIFHPVHAAHGMVVSESALATQVGVDVLRRGGNAVDAAVAVGFALAVTMPQAGNLGGGGFLLLHDARTGRDIAIDFRETAPAAATRGLFLDERGNVVPQRSLFTHAAVGVPGSVAGLLQALQRHGTLPRAVVLQPAIALAEQGFIVSPQTATMLADGHHLARWPASRAVFFNNGRPLLAGERLRQPDLARSLRLIARDGEAAFYRGPIARAIVAEMQRHDGLVSAADLAGYHVVEREPVRGSYRGLQIVAMPPPSSGGVHIVQMLNLLERYPLQRLGAGSAATLHLMAESMKLAYADRAEYLGDADFVHVPLQGLTAKAYADELARKIDPEHAMPAPRPGAPQPYEGTQTTHFSVADAQGNAVSLTTTLNIHFGSGIVVPGTGILLNNQMDDFVAKPGVPNIFGLLGGDANAIAPGKRPLSSMSPTLVLKDGKPWLITGSPGGSRIITTVLQTLVDIIDFGMNPAEAAAQPRIHHQGQPDELRVERGISPDTVALLRQRGHTVVERAAFGRTQTIQCTAEGFSGAADPRNPDGLAAGY